MKMKIRKSDSGRDGGKGEVRDLKKLNWKDQAESKMNG